MADLKVEIAYALPTKQTLLELLVAEGATVEEAIKQSGILGSFSEIDLQKNKVGIWNKTVKLDTPLKNFDRIEIYRPLIADPKEVRKRRAEKAKEEGRADKVTGGRPNPLKSNPKHRD